MGSYRRCGSQGLAVDDRIDAGTSCLQPSPRPGTVHVAATASAQRQPGATPKGEARRLAIEEIAMATSIFKQSVDYAKVRVHNAGYWLFFGLQDEDTAVTPNGEMYFNPKHFKENFATSGYSDRRWFMHEMVHVWQYQLDYPVRGRGMFRSGLSYDYTLAENKRLRDFNMEAQGDLLADYWALKTYGTPPYIRQQQYAQQLPLYEKVLQDFILDPANKSNLPRDGL